MTVIDFSAAYPSAQSIKSAGHEGVVLYISPPREAWMNGKRITRAIIDSYKAAGLSIAVVWQYGGGSNPDVMRGANGGRADAIAAEAKLKEVGLDNWPVFFNVDFDISVGQWNNTAVHYFRAAAEVLGRNRVGVYGHSKVCHWAGPEDKVVAEVAPGRFLAWQTLSWSKGVKGSDYCVLYQGIHNVKGPDGIQIDINEVWFDNWGQRPVGNSAPSPAPKPTGPSMNKNPGHRGDPLFLPELLKAWGVKVAEFDSWRQRGQGDFGQILGVVAHHTAGANTPPSLIAFGHSALRGLLSQICLTKDGTAHIVGAGIAYHAGAGSGFGWPYDNANSCTIGIEAVNAGDGRDPWPSEQLEAYYRICAAICWYLDLPASKVAGHKEWSSGGKIDPHPIDMPDFRNRVQALINNPPFASGPTEEEQEMQFWSEVIPSLVDRTKKFARRDFIQLIDFHATKANEQSKQALDEAKLIREDQARLDAKLDTILAKLGGK